MGNVLPRTREEWMAVWAALTQYVDNNDPDEDWQTSQEDRNIYEAACSLLARFDAEIAKIASKVPA